MSGQRGEGGRRGVGRYSSLLSFKPPGPRHGMGVSARMADSLDTGFATHHERGTCKCVSVLRV